MPLPGERGNQGIRGSGPRRPQVRAPPPELQRETCYHLASLDRRFRMARVWQLQEAKNKLSEVVEEALHHGPQVISRRGTEVAVVLSVEEYLTLKKSQTNLAQFFLESPLRGSNLNLKRDKRPAGRDIS